jgi:hypothetical protein
MFLGVTWLDILIVNVKSVSGCSARFSKLGCVLWWN